MTIYTQTNKTINTIMYRGFSFFDGSTKAINGVLMQVHGEKENPCLTKQLGGGDGVGTLRVCLLRQESFSLPSW